MAPPDQPVRFSHRITHLVRVPDALVLVEDTGWHLVEDEAMWRLLELVDGRRTVAELATMAPDLLGAAQVHFFLMELQRAGVLAEASGDPHRPPVDGATGMNADVRRLNSGLAEAWARADRGIAAVTGEVWGLDLGCRLLLVDDYLRPELVARVTSLSGGPDGSAVLLARVGTEELWLGPVVGSSQSCLSCLQCRLRQTLPLRGLIHSAFQASAGDLVALSTPEASRRTLEALTRALPTTEHDVRRLAHEIRRWVGTDEPRTHAVVRGLPGCHRCRRSTAGRADVGSTGTAYARPLRSSGGYRGVTAETTWDRLRHHVDPVMGLVRRLERVAMPRDEMFVYTASHVTHGANAGPTSLRSLRRDTGGGKGRTDVDARVSAICECLERYSALHQGSEPVRRARASEVHGPKWLPNDLSGYSRRQYEERAEWNPKQSGHFQIVPEPYDDEVVDWTTADDLVTGRSHALPASYVYASFRGEGTRFCRADSNGLSAGNCREEAILQGFFELVERDAVALWWYNRARRPPVAMSGADPWGAEMLALHDELARDAWLLDLTTDLGIPVYAAVSAARDDSRPEIVFGFGAHVDSGIALRRAVTELNQMLPSVLQPEVQRKRQLLPDFADAVRWWECTRLEDVPYLLPDQGVTPSPVQDLPGREDVTFGDIVAWCVNRVRERDLSLLVHDLTRPEAELSVVKVIVPGLRHFWRRLGPGRLYEVPVALGWMDEHVREEEMNPVSLFV